MRLGLSKACLCLSCTGLGLSYARLHLSWRQKSDMVKTKPKVDILDLS